MRMCSDENVPSHRSRQPIQGLQQPADKANIYPQTHADNTPPLPVPASIYLQQHTHTHTYINPETFPLQI